MIALMMIPEDESKVAAKIDEDLHLIIEFHQRTLLCPSRVYHRWYFQISEIID